MASTIVGGDFMTRFSWPGYGLTGQPSDEGLCGVERMGEEVFGVAGLGEEWLLGEVLEGAVLTKGWSQAADALGVENLPKDGRRSFERSLELTVVVCLPLLVQSLALAEPEVLEAEHLYLMMPSLGLSAPENLKGVLQWVMQTKVMMWEMLALC